MNGGLSRGQTAVCRTESRFYVKRDSVNYRFAFFAIFVLDIRCAGAVQTTGSVPVSWASHSTVGLAVPPPLLESVAGRKYHYPPAFHRQRKAVPFSEPIFVALPSGVMAHRSKGCRGVSRLQD